MRLLALGLNHHSAPLELREQTAFAPEQLEHALKDLAATGVAEEASILSTCNRTELYCHHEGIRPDALVRWICDYRGLTQRQIGACLYHHDDQEAVKHAFRVASGLDSMVLGEPQILGQMKMAFQQARNSGTIGKVLNRLFQQSFSVAKKVRTDTSIGANAVSVAFAAVELAKQIFSSLSEQTVILIGAGDTIELAALHLRENSVRKIIVANRTVSRAKLLAERINGEAISLAELPQRLQEADILIASTASQLPILGKGAVERALRTRRHKPMFMVDIAVPRDIESEVAELDDVYLYTVDDLQDVVSANLTGRQEAAVEAEKIIDIQVVSFMRWMSEQNVVPAIREFRSTIDSLRSLELQKAQQRLAAGEDPYVVMEYLANSLTNKFCHGPSTAIKKAGQSGNLSAVNTIRKIFNLKDPQA